MKVFNIILAVLFLAFAVLQLNDAADDILFWVLIYGLVSVVSAFGAFDRYNMWVIVAGIAATVYRLFRDLPEFLMWVNLGMPDITGEMKATSPYIESAREFFGLVLCIIVFIFHYVRYSRIRHKRMIAESQRGI